MIVPRAARRCSQMQAFFFCGIRLLVSAISSAISNMFASNVDHTSSSLATRLTGMRRLVSAATRSMAKSVAATQSLECSSTASKPRRSARSARSMLKLVPARAPQPMLHRFVLAYAASICRAARSTASWNPTR